MKTLALAAVAALALGSVATGAMAQQFGAQQAGTPAVNCTINLVTNGPVFRLDVLVETDGTPFRGILDLGIHDPTRTVDVFLREIIVLGAGQREFAMVYERTGFANSQVDINFSSMGDSVRCGQ